MKTIIRFLFIWCITPSVLSGQKPPCQTCECILKRAEETTDFEEAIKQYNSARNNCPTMTTMIDGEIIEVFKKINLLRVKAEKAEKDAKAAQVKAQKALDDAKIAETKAIKALESAKAANERVVKSYLRDIEQHILKLEYEAAAEKCQTALALDVENQKPAIAQYVFEVAYWFTETDTTAAAVNILKLLNINVLPNRADLRKAIETHAPPQYFATLEERYYPKMIDVEGGTFTMGSNEYDDEKPPHPVKVSSFKIAETETTVWQYFLFQKAAKHREPQTPTWQWKGNNPIVNVSWEDAVAYHKWLSQRLNKSFRLPTEAEWEFAARGGNASKGYKYSGSNDIEDVAWYSDNSKSQTHPVKTRKKANELGLYDMSGNVWEWCADKYSDKYYAECAAKGTVENPQGPTEGSGRPLRGGSWDNGALNGRVSYRIRDYEYFRSYYYGFRLLQDK